MIALVQRTKEASVVVDSRVTGAIGKGFLILLGIHRDDTPEEMRWVARKCANLRVFPDDDGKMNRSLTDVEGDALVVSQFTLYGATERGNRPSFTESAPPEVAQPLYDQFIRELNQLIGRPVGTGVFGAMMDVRLINDGPVTLWIERKPGEKG